MKFFQKKEITLEKTPILFRLERRHTLLDGVKDEETVGESKRAFRANSVGSYTRSTTPTSTKPHAAISKLCLSDGSRSNYSAASTVVITESELSSSWLYNTRKAKIDSDDETTSTITTAQTEDPDIQPVPMRDPEMKPIPVPLKKRPEKKSSCCCYMLVVLTICLASLGIMAAIGGIIYMEVFAVYKNMVEIKHGNMKSSLDGTELSTLHPNEGWSLNGFRVLVEDTRSVQDLNNGSWEIGDDSNKEDLTHNPFSDQPSEKGSDASNTKLSKDPKTSSDINEKLSKNAIKENSLHHDNDVIEDFLHVDGTNPEISENSSDLLDSKFEGNSRIVTNGKSTSDQEVSSDSNGNERNVELEDKEIIDKHKSAESNLDGLKSMLKNQTNSRYPRMELDSLESGNEEIRMDNGNPEDLVHEDVEYENIFGIEPQSEITFDDSSFDYDMVMNRPVVEAKPPIDFQTRLINNQNRDDDKPLTGKDLEMKYTLSEILKLLRTLDANNQLPSTRQSQKTGTEAATSSMSTQDIGAERKEYLSNLRKRMYN